MSRRWWVLLAAVAFLATAATPAYAAKLTLTGKTLFAVKSAADAVPQQLVHDTFASTTGVTLDGRAANPTGQPWDVVLGTLQVTGGQVRCSACGGGSYGAALIDGDLAQVTATVNLRLNGATGATPGSAGLVMNANAAGTQAIVVWWDTNVVSLYKYVGGVLSPALAQATTVGLSATADTPLVVKYSAGTYTVSFKTAATLFSYTMSAGDQTSFGSSTYFGIAFLDDPDRIRLDEFEVKR